MSQTTIYMKGDAGFKAAVLTKLGGKWIHGAQDVEADIVSFSLPENVKLAEFKALIGKAIVADYNVSFFNELEDGVGSEEVKFVPGRQIKMSIWANTNSNLKGMKAMAHDDDGKR